MVGEQSEVRFFAHKEKQRARERDVAESIPDGELVSEEKGEVADSEEPQDAEPQRSVEKTPNCKGTN